MTWQKLFNNPRTQTMELWHGSPSVTPPVPTVGEGRFDGIFCTTDRRRVAHGTHTHRYEVPNTLVLTNYTLNYELDAHETILAVLAREAAPDADLERVWEIVVEDPGNQVADDDLTLFRGVEDLAEAGWEAQRIRGRVAAALGYTAVEMHDEHGTSWLLVG